VDRAGRVFITDIIRDCVVVLNSSDGRFLFEFGGKGSGAGQFDGPTGIVLSEDGQQIFVVDQGNHRVCMFDGNGKFLKTFGSQGAGDGQLYGPVGIGFDEGRSEVFVADMDNHRVCVFDVRSGRFVRSFGRCGSGNGELNAPMGLNLATVGQRVYVADRENRRVAIFTMDGGWVGAIGEGQLRRVRRVAVDREEMRLAVADAPEGIFASTDKVHLYTA
jgi:DNA-binding beta-propeller fold protein YncE